MLQNHVLFYSAMYIFKQVCEYRSVRAYADKPPQNWVIIYCLKTGKSRPGHAMPRSWCSNLPQRSAQLITLAVSSFPSVATLLSVRAGEAASDTHTQKLAETVLMHMHTQISITLVYKTQITASNCAYTTQTNISFSKLTLKSFHIEHNHCWPTC